MTKYWLKFCGSNTPAIFQQWLNIAVWMMGLVGLLVFVFKDGIRRFLFVSGRVWIQAWGGIPGVCAGQSLGQKSSSLPGQLCGTARLCPPHSHYSRQDCSPPIRMLTVSMMRRSLWQILSVKRMDNVHWTSIFNFASVFAPAKENTVDDNYIREGRGFLRCLLHQSLWQRRTVQLPKHCQWHNGPRVLSP